MVPALWRKVHQRRTIDTGLMCYCRYIDHFFKGLNYFALMQFCKVRMACGRHVADPMGMLCRQEGAFAVYIRSLVYCMYFLTPQVCMECIGAIIFTGVGKSGFIAQKVSQVPVTLGAHCVAGFLKVSAVISAWELRHVNSR